MFLFYTCPEPKPGKCPVINEGSFGTCDEGCTTDHDCEGNAKCCSNGCGSVCGKCLVPRGGEGGSYGYQCTTDRDCEGNTKCCSN